MAIRLPKERDVQRTILQYLRLLGWPAWRFNSGAMQQGDRFVRFNTAKGCSDLLFIAPGGLFGACEVKCGKNRPTALQAAFLEMVRRSGGVAVVARSVQELDAALRERGLIA